MSLIKPDGKWFITLYGPDGSVKAYREGHNVITQDGKSFLAGFLMSAAAAASTFTMQYVALGSDSTAEADTQTALGTELARVAATISQVTGGIYRATASFGAGVGTGNIYEYGLFSTATTAAGTMFSRDTEGLVTKGASDTLVAITEITFS